MFVWKGKELSTYGKLLDAAQECKTKEEAIEFLRQYTAEVGVYAKPNLKYLFGYLGSEEGLRLRRLFFG